MADAPKKLTHLLFHKACIALKKNKQEFLEKRPAADEAGNMLSIFAGFPISGASIADMQEATGIKWASRRDSINTRSTTSSIRQNAIATLTRAVAALYEELGLPLTKGLDSLVNLVRNQDARTTPSEQVLPENQEGDDVPEKPRQLLTTERPYQNITAFLDDKKK